MIIINNPEILKIILAVLSLFVSIKIAKDNIITPNKLKTKKSQFKYVYLPLFRLIEPNLYKEIDHKTATEYMTFMNDIIEKYYELISVDLVSWIRKFSIKVSSNKRFNNEFEQICQIVDNEFERLRKFLALPHRGMIYRFNHNQIPLSLSVKISFFLISLTNLIYHLFIMIIFGFTINFIFSIFK